MGLAQHLQGKFGGELSGEFRPDKVQNFELRLTTPNDQIDIEKELSEHYNLRGLKRSDISEDGCNLYKGPKENRGVTITQLLHNIGYRITEEII